MSVGAFPLQSWELFVMQDKRCVRFASVGEMTEQELGLAIDVWLDDALKAPWATKDQ